MGRPQRNYTGYGHEGRPPNLVEIQQKRKQSFLSFMKLLSGPRTQQNVRGNDMYFVDLVRTATKDYRLPLTMIGERIGYSGSTVSRWASAESLPPYAARPTILSEMSKMMMESHERQKGSDLPSGIWKKA